MEGIIYLHERNVIHWDLKPANIFISKGEVKIGDFGLATQFEGQIKNYKNFELVGTPLYIAPEYDKSRVCDYKIDMYALGILLFEILSNFRTAHSWIKEISYLREKGKVK